MPQSVYERSFQYVFPLYNFSTYQDQDVLFHKMEKIMEREEYSLHLRAVPEKLSLLFIC